METIQITIDSQLLRLVDKECGRRQRSSFFRDAAESRLKQLQIQKLEEKHKKGYEKYPVRSSELDDWLDEQAWPE